MNDICALSIKKLPTCLKPVEALILKNTKEKSIEQFKQSTGCLDDICVLDKASLEPSELEKIKARVFKVPTKSFDHNYWINNTEIDSVLYQMRCMFPGFAHGYIHMLDFKSFNPSNQSIFDYPVPNVLDIDFAKEFNLGLHGNPPKDISTYNDTPFKSFGAVFNTDTSRGSGQHWFAIYISSDLPDPELPQKKMIQIELFNSAGGPPVSASTPDGKRFNEFWETTALKIAQGTGLKCEYKVITNIEHQRSDTGNCGAYSLFYIFQRLKKCHPREFDNPRRTINDESMREFREVCFTVKDNTSVHDMF